MRRLFLWGTPMTIKRRDFLAGAGGIVAAAQAMHAKAARAQTVRTPAADARAFNTEYSGEHLEQVAFPMGGIGAGTICLEGAGALSHVSIRNRPEIFNEPCIFAAIAVKANPAVARVLEGPVPKRKIFAAGSGLGFPGTTYGLPRFAAATFAARFPFGTVTLSDPDLPLDARITGWSPFEPGKDDDFSLPVCALEYRFTNRATTSLDLVFSFNAKNFLADDTTPEDLKAVRAAEGGLTLWNGAPTGKPWQESFFSAEVSEPETKVNHAWFRGDWWDAVTLAWKDVARGAAYDARPPASGLSSPGASIFVPFTLVAGASRTIPLRLCWYSGKSNLRSADDPFAWPWPEGQAGTAEADTYRPGMPDASMGSKASAPIGAIIIKRCAMAHFASAIASTTAPCRPKRSRQCRPISASSNRLPSCARPMAEFGGGKVATTIPVHPAARALAPMCGITPSPCRICFPRWSGLCAKPNSALRRTRLAIRLSGTPCPSGPACTNSMPPPTASWAAS